MNPAITAEWDAMQAACEPHYTSEPMLIGRTHWRMVIKDHVIGWKVVACTNYQWQDQSGHWRGSQHWPTYDGDDTYDGLPRTLSKLYERERAHVDRIIYGKEPEPDRQLGLGL